jgi:hypothetical protein
MPIVEFDVYLSDFDTRDLCLELSSRITAYGKEQLTKKQREDLKASISDYPELFMDEDEDEDDSRIEIKTLDDKMKLEHFAKVFHKYTVAEIEAKLPE